jgi:hypothetical protein
MSTRLSDHLYPKGKSVSEPNVMPNVLDSDSNPIDYYSSERKTTEATVVNIGSSPNSNDGDPLRTAFGKINNFMEASYWVNESLNEELANITTNIERNFTRIIDNDSDILILATGIDGGTY